MRTPKPDVVFFGTGPVAAKSLELLLENFDVEAVVTKPKPKHHRGDFPVLDVATGHGLRVISVTDKQSVSSVVKNGDFKSQLAILIDFGIIVAKDVIDAFPLGIVNSHFSLLPRWRGADPITFAILSGDENTGVSLMILDEGMDTGKIIGQKTLRIDPNDTTPTLTENLIALSNDMLARYVPEYISGKVKPRQQPHPDRATYSRRLAKADGAVDWNKPATEIEREVRAYAGWPKSYATLGTVDVVITKARAVSSGHKGSPGDITIDDETGALAVGCKNGSLRIEALKPAGKSEMPAADFIRGYKTRLS